MKSESTSSVSPDHRPNGVSRSKKLPVNSWELLIGRPWSRSPSPTPRRSGMSALPMVSDQRQAALPAGVVELALVLEGDPARHEGG